MTLPLETAPDIAPLEKIPLGGNPRGLVRVRTPPCGSDGVSSTGWCHSSNFRFKNVATDCGGYLRGDFLSE